MNLRRNARRAALPVAFVLAAGCACGQGPRVKGPKGTDRPARLAVSELAIRYACGDLQGVDTVVVAFGRTWDGQSPPPHDFLDRFSDGPARFVASGDGPGAALRLLVDVTGWESDTEAVAVVTAYRRGAGAADGWTVRAVWKSGAWSVDRADRVWHT